jgi:hypothetical protein
MEKCPTEWFCPFSLLMLEVSNLRNQASNYVILNYIVFWHTHTHTHTSVVWLVRRSNVILQGVIFLLNWAARYTSIHKPPNNHSCLPNLDLSSVFLQKTQMTLLQGCPVLQKVKAYANYAENNTVSLMTIWTIKSTFKTPNFFANACHI